MSIFDGFFLSRRARGAGTKDKRLSLTVDRILAMNPRFRNARHYEKRLGRALETALSFADDLVGSLPPVRDANYGAWSSDSVIRAFFATADDLAEVFSRSDAVRECFDKHADLTDGYAVLGMAMTERHVLGVALEGDTVRHDVQQTALLFSDHRVRICSESEEELRAEIARRLIDQLALDSFSSLASNRRDLARQSRILIKERAALLERQGTGLRSVVGVPEIRDSDELAQLQAQIEKNSQALARLRAPDQSAELELEYACNELSKPSEHVHIESRHVCIDLMNIMQPQGQGVGRDIEVHVASIPGSPPVVRAFALVRFPRRELLPAGLHIDAAMLAM